jgi:hypothetical protein
MYKPNISYKKEEMNNITDHATERERERFLKKDTSFLFSLGLWT